MVAWRQTLLDMARSFHEAFGRLKTKKHELVKKTNNRRTKRVSKKELNKTKNFSLNNTEMYCESKNKLFLQTYFVWMKTAFKLMKQIWSEFNL